MFGTSGLKLGLGHLRDSSLLLGMVPHPVAQTQAVSLWTDC